MHLFFNCQQFRLKTITRPPHQTRREQATAGGGARGDDRPKSQLRFPKTQGGGRREAQVLLTGGKHCLLPPILYHLFSCSLLPRGGPQWLDLT